MLDAGSLGRLSALHGTKVSRVIPAGTTKAQFINHAVEVEPHVPPARVPVEPRDWKVTDAEARATAAEKVLGAGADDDPWWAQNAMWFIDAEANAAALCVFRPKPSND